MEASFDIALLVYEYKSKYTRLKQFEEKTDYVKKYIDSGIKFLCLRTTPKLPGDIKTLSEMKSNERLLMALHKAVELKSDIELGKLIHYAASIDDLAYKSDEDLALQIE